MAFLSLNDDCLLNILSYLDDPWSFYSFSLACRRFYDVSLKSSRYTEHLKSKIKYYALKFFCEFESEELHWCNEQYIYRLVRLTETYELVQPTQDNILEVWNLKGPVAAEVVTWIKDVDFSARTARGTRDQYETHEVVLFLPKNKQKLDFIFRFRRPCFELSNASVIFPGKKSDTQKSFYLACIPSSQYVNCQAQKQKAEDVTKQILGLFQDELGETNPPLTDEIFHWFFFNGNTLKIVSEESDLKKILFVDSERNQEPNNGGRHIACSNKRSNFWSRMKGFSKSKSHVSQHDMERVANSQLVRKVAEGYKLLQQACKSGDTIISDTENEQIYQYVLLKNCLYNSPSYNRCVRTCNAGNYFFRRCDFWDFYCEAIMKLAFRASHSALYPEGHSRPSKCFANFRLQNGHFLTFSGTIDEQKAWGDGDDYYLFEFVLPDSSVVNLSGNCYFNRQTIQFSPQVEKLTPVTLELERFLDTIDSKRKPLTQKCKEKKIHILNTDLYCYFIYLCRMLCR